MSVVVKPVQHLHTQVPAILCNGPDLLQHVDLNLGRRSVCEGVRVCVCVCMCVCVCVCVRVGRVCEGGEG